MRCKYSQLKIVLNFETFNASVLWQEYIKSDFLKKLYRQMSKYFSIRLKQKHKQWLEMYLEKISAWLIWHSISNTDY